MTDWQPTCTLAAARDRAAALRCLRDFFTARQVLEVETPIAQGGPNRDHGIEPMALAEAGTWLITSPEHHLKRLLCAGWPDIWTLAPCLRTGERSPRHNPEFHMVEWYRLGWDEAQIAQEAVALCAAICGDAANCETISWRAAFQQLAGIDAWTASAQELCAAIPGDTDPSLPREDLWDMLFSLRVAPHLGRERYCLLTHWPASAAAQARLRGDCAARVEIFRHGLELANGYWECTSAQDIASRLQAVQAGPQDQRYLAALAHGLPDCAGIAVGWERLLMLRQGQADIAAVLPFPWESR